MSAAWVLFDRNKKGSENQCLGLARRLKLNYKIYAITVRWWWYCIPRTLWPHPAICLDPVSQLNLKDNLPSFIIASGRISAGIAAGIKKHYGLPVIYILNPNMPPQLFDYIIAPSHDQLAGPNIISVLGSLHPYQFISEHVEDIRKKDSGENRWQHLKSPKIALLVGGSNKHYKLNDTTINRMASELNILHKNQNISLIISFSRRTTQRQRTVLTQAIQSIPHWIWNDQPPNPYKNMLLQADFILITGDSVSMVSEACATGKPIYIIKLPGYSKKFDLFYQTLIEHHHARFFKGMLKAYQSVRLDEAGRICKILQPVINRFK